MKHRTTRARDRQFCVAFTLVELLTVIAVVAVLAALTIGMLGKMREKAEQVDMTNRMRSIGVAMSLAIAEGPYERRPGMFPFTVKPGNGTWVTWYDAIAPYLDIAVDAKRKIPADIPDRGVFYHKLSSSTRTGIDPANRISFAYNYIGLGGPSLGADLPTNCLLNIPHPMEMIVVMPSNEDGVNDYLLNSRWPAAEPREVEPGKSFALFADWHVSAVDTDFLKTTEGFNKHFRGSP